MSVVVENVDGPAVLPYRIRTRLSAYRQGQLAELEGSVLDLNVTGALDEVAGAAWAEARGDEVPTGPYDVVIGTAALLGVPDLHETMRGIAALVADDGEIFLIEPANHPGAWSMILSTAWSYHPVLRGRHVERDLAATVRSVGFTVTDLERIAMPTIVRPLRTFVSLRARRFLQGGLLQGGLLQSDAALDDLEDQR